MKTSDIITAKEWLTEPKKIVIIPHKNPDGDAMGSALGLYHWLIQKHHEVTVIAPNEYPCLLYTSDAADDMQCVDLGGRRIIKKIFFKQKTAYEM